MDRVLCDMSLHLATSSLDRLASWFKTSLGGRLLAEQTPIVEECARRFHGDTLLWAGCHTALLDTVRGCMVRNRFLLKPATLHLPVDPFDSSDLTEFESDVHEIPLPNNSLDAVVLHHVLETAEDPRTAIREFSRALAPGGRLLIVSFNPWSLWGVRGAYARVFRDSFSGMRFVSSRRLLDWLTVLGFELQHKVKYVAYGLPFPTRERDAALWQKLRTLAAGHRLPIGGVYVISAVKQASAVRPDWTATSVRDAKLAPAAYPKLSARVARLPVRSDPADLDRIQDPG
jgi:SAM-dependent methyltransferase